MLSQGPTGSAPGTASVYKMRLRADPHRSQITDMTSRYADEFCLFCFLFSSHDWVCLTHAMLAVLLFAAAADDAEEPRASLLFYKKLSQTHGHAVNKPFNVTLTVYNKGVGNAYSLIVADDNWKADKFRIIGGGNNFTLDFLNAGDTYEHEFVVKPIRKAWHRVRPAKMFYVDGDAGESTVSHLSNSLPDMRVIEKQDSLEEAAIMAGRVLTLNMIKTKQGWMAFAALALLAICAQLYFIGSAVLHKRRHLRALEDVKKL